LVGVDTAASLKSVIGAARSYWHQPDLIILTGDLSQDETAGSYRKLKELFCVFQCPIYYLPGNHDLPEVMDPILTRAPAAFSADRSVVAGDWQIVLLNSRVEGRVEGRLPPDELSYLERCLAGRPDLNAIVCLHHSPVSIGVPWMDEIALTNPEDLFAVLDRFQVVRAVVWGHIHQEFESSQGAVRLLAAPSTCIQFKSCLKFGVDTRPPGYRWFRLSAKGQLDTGVKRLAHAPEGLDLTAAGY